MLIDLSSFFREEKQLLSFDGALKIEDFNLGGRDIRFTEPIGYKGEVFKVDGENRINISLNYTYYENCNRCLVNAENQIKTIFSGKLVEGKEQDNEELEIEDYDEVVYYENDIIDPEDFIYKQVILSLPMKTLCNEQCRGLCITCGIDLNNFSCDCTDENIDPRFEQLKNFFSKN